MPDLDLDAIERRVRGTPEPMIREVVLALIAEDRALRERVARAEAVCEWAKALIEHEGGLAQDAYCAMCTAVDEWSAALGEREGEPS